MPFMKKGEVARRSKVAAANIKRGIETEKRRKAQKGILTPVGRRVFELSKLATEMWCKDCDIPLSFRFVEEENICGLNSIFKIRCCKCLVVYRCASSSSTPNPSGEGNRPLYAVNCKIALGCIDSGVGHEQLNKLLSAVNLPTICRNTVKLAEERVGPAIVTVAKESCMEALSEEKRLTLERRASVGLGHQAASQPMDISPEGTPPTSPSRNTCDISTPRRPRLPSEDTVDITIKYDFGWDTRGSGFQYNSHSGRGSMIGNESNKVLGYEVMSSYCPMCARGLKPGNHVCAKNYEGSAKGMEPRAAVNLCVKNDNLGRAGVRVAQLIGDRDSSTMAALRRESPHHIGKILDINHNTKSFNNALWNLKKTKHKFLTAETINYLKRCLNYAIYQNKGNVEVVRNSILNISRHTFGEHSECGEWCKAKGEPDYKFDFLPGKKPFSCPVWRQDLEAVLHGQADDAEMLAPAGSSLANESFNHMCNTRAPKSRHYCGTSANLFRVSSAVCCKNLGVESIDRILQTALLSPSSGKFRNMLEKRRQQKAMSQNHPRVKRRRLLLKMARSSGQQSSSRKEGMTYVSGMSGTMEKAAAAAAVSTWMPVPQALQDNCRPVIVDTETTGLLASSEIVQLAAKCGDQKFSVNIVPRGEFSPQAAEVTGMSVRGGKLWQHGKCLQTVPAIDAAKQFIEFLQQCSSQVILVGHNIIRFDAKRIILFLREFNLVKELCDVVFGITDTLPLISQGKMRKQDLLAATYLTGPNWQEVIMKAHDALADCILLDGLLEHFKISEETVKTSVLPMRDFLERQAFAKRKKDNTPALMAMTEHKVSKAMVGKMAGHGITIAELKTSYTDHGRKGLEVCLGVQIDGAPRVTRSKKVIDQVEAFLKASLS